MTLLQKNIFPNYKLEVDNLEIVDRKSRTGMLIHSQIYYKRRVDLETQGTSTIWIQLSHPGRKPILVSAVYRQFQRLGVVDSDSIRNKKIRWKKIVEKWEQAAKEDKETIVMGDFNLNTLRWDTPPQENSSYERSQIPLVDNFKEKILQQGFKILNNSATRTKDNTESRPACLDLILTNKPEKVASFSSGIPSFSDHTLQVLTRSTKGLTRTQKYLRTRSYKQFNLQDYKQNILNHRRVPRDIEGDRHRNNCNKNPEDNPGKFGHHITSTDNPDKTVKQ